MNALAEAATDFLVHKRIAVAGVTRAQGSTANMLWQRLRSAGYETFPVNPNADEVEGERCYRSLAAIPGGVDGVLVVTHPDVAPAVVRECATLGIPRVWLHRGPVQGSWSAEAVAECERAGIAVIDGACPLMFLNGGDPPHKVMRWVLGLFGKLPDGHRYHACAGVATKA